MNKDPNEMIKELMAASGQGDAPQLLGPDGTPIGGPENPLEIIGMVVQNLEMGYVQLAQNMQQIGGALDASRLTINLLVNMLISKGVFNEEEFKSEYKVKVGDVLEEQHRLAKEKYDEYAAQQEAAAGQTPEETTTECSSSCDKKDCCCGCSEETDVVLPSERSNVVSFPTKE